MSREDSMRILKKFFVDIFLISGLVLCIYATNSLWVPFERGYFCGDESLMFPYRNDTVTTPMLRIFGLGLPILAFFLCEWVLLRKEVDDQRILSICIPAWLRGFYCPLASFAFGTCFIELTTNVAKNVIGRPRPHFFDLCKPSVDCSLPEWQKRYVQAHEYQCMGDQTDKFIDMHMSFLSGHSAWSAFTMFYLALYLEKRMVWRGTRVLRHSLQFAAVMLSWFTALSRVSDYKHHWSDVLAGYFLGMTFAVLIWTWGTDILEPKRKHKALPQHELNSIHHQQMAAPA
ncbi:putative phosphatidate phosphatase isoform X1 [Pararge aegeria]|uniref:Jg5906 protein n=2 Tax=Pararge aegeria TaxID=116150 RepID=A0A8S4RHX9_9NEOP|nr:putative phosphatidate phosphatase isoform X1 [Pararge aegeria]CAH2235336.1 jg5906 [Pararge aegeria aegeria]